MKTKDKVIELLKNKSGEYLSGQEIADELYVTRACVWKCIKALSNEGYSIDAVTNKGYRLRISPDEIKAEVIAKELSGEGIDLEVLYYDEVTSTNDKALEYATTHMGNALVIADGQTAGRGRRGRDFYSPKGTGLYMSLLLKSFGPLEQSVGITAMAASAVSKAIDSCLKLTDGTNIKWVNDIYYQGKKVCGILSEAHSSLEDEELKYIVIGIGVNIFAPEHDFPREIKSVADSLLHGNAEDYAGIRNKLCVEIVRNLFHYYYGGEKARKESLEYYREKSMLKGSYVKINSFSGDNKYAKVLGISDDYHLQVEYDNGQQDQLSSGEVSVVKY